MTQTTDSRLTLRIDAKNDIFRPYEHQQAAWNSMSRTFDDDKKSSGIVVVPTGGGKTVIAARWLLEHHIRQGGRILWLAHRLTLLKQAQNAFIGHAHIAIPKKELKIIRISGEDCRWSDVSGDDDLFLSTIQSAAREENEGFVEQAIIQSHQGIYVVVDEAHHAAAPQYQRLLTKLKNRGAKLIGLTATPVRMNDDDSKRLWNLFDANLVFEIRQRELIEKGILSAPHFETVKTQITQEQEFTDSDYDYLRRWGDLGPRVLERLAKNASRNNLIVEHYQKNSEKYGKMILFAIDTLHAKTLVHEFEKAGISSDYVDYMRTDNEAVLNKFRSIGKPDVVTNVEILTEGFDAPKTKSIFLCRPTRSESLLAQMVGRALRGPHAGGTERKHIWLLLSTRGRNTILLILNISLWLVRLDHRSRKNLLPNRHYRFLQN